MPAARQGASLWRVFRLGICVVVWLGWPALHPFAAELQLGSVLGEPGAAGEEGSFARADSVRPLVFPADHGPHERFKSEWWYLTANLKDAEGAAFGVQFTAFRRAVRADPAAVGPWSGNQLYLAHLALTDVEQDRHLEAERLARGLPGIAGARADPFRVWVDGWALTARPGPVDADFSLAPFSLDGRSEKFDVQLALQARKPVVLQGDRGLSRKGLGQASYYYSVTRIAAAGTVRVGQRMHEVEGEAWLDREWSTNLLSARQQGWDWFGLQLEGNEELMIFQLRRDDTSRDPYDQGLWVDRMGHGQLLRATDFDLRPLSYWHDEIGIAWPVAWRLEVRLPTGSRRYRIEALVDNQRMDTFITYWEGLVQVLDELGRPAGTGYMELTGYD